jgi:transposase
MTLVIGVDPHKQTHTAVAVRSASGEFVDELCATAQASGYAQLLTWALALESEHRVWAIEDVRGVSRGLERFLLEHDERVVRVPPKLMAQARKSTRTYGKSDSIDALAIARAALAHPQLPTVMQDDAARDLQLLINHREALVRQRSEAQDRLRWLLHDIDPDLRIPAGALDRTVWLDRVARRLARGEQSVAVRIARDLVRRCRTLTREANELEREIAFGVGKYAPQLLQLKGCGALIAGKIIGETGGAGRFRNDAQFARLAGVAPIDASSGQQRRHRLNATATASSTARCTRSRSSKAAAIPAPAPTSPVSRLPARAAWKRSARSNATSPAPSSGCCANSPPRRHRSSSRCAAGTSVCPFLPEAAVVVLMPVRSQPAGLQEFGGLRATTASAAATYCSPTTARDHAVARSAAERPLRRRSAGRGRCKNRRNGHLTGSARSGTDHAASTVAALVRG